MIGGGAIVVQELARALGTRAGIDSLVVSEHDILTASRCLSPDPVSRLIVSPSRPRGPGTLGVSGTFGSLAKEISSRGNSGDEPVAHPGFGDEMPGLGWIVPSFRRS